MIVRFLLLHRVLTCCVSCLIFVVLLATVNSSAVLQNDARLPMSDLLDVFRFMQKWLLFFFFKIVSYTAKLSKVGIYQL